MISSDWLALSLPLADLEQWRRMGDRFSGQHLQIQTEDIVGFFVVVALLVGLFFILRVAAKWELKTKANPQPKRLLGQLAAAHGFSRTELKKLRLLAKATGVSDIAQLFVRPEVFQGAAAETVIGTTDLKSLRERLFGESATA